MHENGLMEKLREKWWPAESVCEPYTTTRATKVTTADMQSVFYLLLIGAALGLLALCLEYVLKMPLWARLKKRCMRQKNT